MVVIIGFDFDSQKVELAKKKGITAINPLDGNNQVKFVESYTNGVGADGVIITALIRVMRLSRSLLECVERLGRIILIGVIGLDISRADFYEKEITFQVSCSYGAGRYDDNYEQNGQDYPIGYVRWTEKRNFEAILNAMSNGQIDVKPLVTERVSLNEYMTIHGNMTNSKSIATILVYDNNSTTENCISITNKSFEGKKGVVGIIGSGNFTGSTILPNHLKSLMQIYLI